MQKNVTSIYNNTLFSRPLWNCIFETPIYKNVIFKSPIYRKWHFRDPHIQSFVVFPPARHAKTSKMVPPHTKMAKIWPLHIKIDQHLTPPYTINGQNLTQIKSANLTLLYKNFTPIHKTFTSSPLPLKKCDPPLKQNSFLRPYIQKSILRPLHTTKSHFWYPYIKRHGISETTIY